MECCNRATLGRLAKHCSSPDTRRTNRPQRKLQSEGLGSPARMDFSRGFYMAQQSRLNKYSCHSSSRRGCSLFNSIVRRCELNNRHCHSVRECSYHPIRRSHYRPITSAVSHLTEAANAPPTLCAEGPSTHAASSLSISRYSHSPTRFQRCKLPHRHYRWLSRRTFQQMLPWPQQVQLPFPQVPPLQP